MGRRASLGSGEYVVVGGVRHVVPYEHDFTSSRCRRRARWRTRCSTTCGSKDRWRATEPSGYARASKGRPERASRSLSNPRPAPVRARPRVPTADDPPTTRLASFIRRDPVVPPRSPSRPPPLNLAQDVELAAGRVAVADGPMRARLPVGGDIPAEWWRVPATLDLVVAADDWRLRVTRHVHEPAVASAEPEILHEDDRLVFVDKPAGVPSCAAGVGPGLPGENNCVALLNRERRSRPSRKRARVEESKPEPALVDQLFAVNRVDKPVSGVWILAKGSKRSGKARAALNKPGALKRKTHLALTKGRVRATGVSSRTRRFASEKTVARRSGATARRTRAPACGQSPRWTDPRLERSSPLGWTSRDDSTRFARTARTRATPSSGTRRTTRG